MFENVPNNDLISALRQRGQFWVYSIRWGSNTATANIAQNGNAESSVQIDNGYVFVVDDISFGAYSSAAGLSFSRGQEAAGTAPSMGGLRILITDSKGPWMTQGSADGIGADLLTGKGDLPKFPLTKPMIGGGDKITGRLTNFTATTVHNAELALIGFRVRAPNNFALPTV